MGKIILVGGEKGGTSKTTTAVNLAALCALAGKDVLLVDTDRQESASTWAATRAMTRAEQDLPPDMTCVAKTGKVGYDLEQLSHKYDVVIVDSGGRDSIELRQAMAVCDFMLILTRPSQFDTWSLDKMAMLLKDVEERVGAKIPAKVLLAAASTNPAVKEAEELRALLASDYADDFGTMFANTTDRIAYRRAARNGMSVMELPRNQQDQTAMEEVQRLYKEVFDEHWTPAKEQKVATSHRQQAGEA